MTYGPPVNNRYLDGRVATASQPELQLMLLEGALRFGRQARQLWDDPGQQIESDRLLRRTLDIAEELTRSVGGGKPEASNRLEEEYAFAFRALTAAQVGRDVAQLDAALRILAIHRETWRQACDKLRAQPLPRLDYGGAPATGFSFQA
jgi:flagellar protein FliS